LSAWYSQTHFFTFGSGRRKEGFLSNNRQKNSEDETTLAGGRNLGVGTDSLSNSVGQAESFPREKGKRDLIERPLARCGIRT